MFYKYLKIGSRTFNGILDEQELYYAKPSALNDPFEVLPIYTVPRKSKLKKYYIKNNLHLDNLKNAITINLNRMCENKSIFIENGKNNANNYGVLCLTPFCDDLLM